MRPCRGAKRIKKIGISTVRLAVPICCTQNKARLANAIITPTAQNIGEFVRRERFAALIQKHSAMRGLGVRNASANIGQFGKFGRPSDSLVITRNQLRLRRTSNLTASDDVKEDEKNLRA